MAILQPLIDMAEICFQQGIRHVVISPGSRSAALTLAFARHGGFQAHVCIDERSAGFIALGMAQQIDSPVVLICTSGSAAYNFAPAVSEAFFSRFRYWYSRPTGLRSGSTNMMGKLSIRQAFLVRM
jgi:2-succinyl-5-enolpyruvyl-6-hydroxy-3-cyclohexene-1-carboxylate synthase